MKQENREEVKAIIIEIIVALLVSAILLVLSQYAIIGFYLKLIIIFLLIFLLIFLWHLFIKINLFNIYKIIRVSGIMNCYLYKYDEITESSKSLIENSEDSFFAFLKYGSRVTSDMKIFGELSNRIAQSGSNEQVKLIVCNPNSKLINEKTKEQIEHTLRELSRYKARIKVKFYPENYLPVMRVLFIDNKYLILSFYPEDKTKKIIQLKIKNKEHSLYVPIKEYCDQIWNGSTDIIWEKDVK